MADRPLSQIWGALRPAPLKVQAGGTLPRRSPLHPWNVAAGSPTWILLEFPQSVTPLPPPLSPPYLHQESLLVHKSHHVFRANDHISPALLPVPLCPLPGQGFLSPGRWPEDPPAGCHWPGLPWLEARTSSYVFTRGWGEEGAESEGNVASPNTLPDLASSGGPPRKGR